MHREHPGQESLNGAHPAAPSARTRANRAVVDTSRPPAPPARVLSRRQASRGAVGRSGAPMLPAQARHQSNRGAGSAADNSVGPAATTADVLHDLDIAELENLLQQSQAAVSRLAGNAVLVVGESGAGKSTFINYMNDNLEIHEDDMTGIMSVSARRTQGDAPVISRANAGSCTVFPKAHRSAGRMFIDTAGYFDSRGVAHDISVHCSLASVLKSVKVEAIIVVLPSKICEPANRCMGVVPIVQALENITGSNEHTYKRSVFYLFNESLEQRRPKTAIQRCKIFERYLAEYSRSYHASEVKAASCLRKILACDILTYDPMDPAARASINAKISRCRPLHTPAGTSTFTQRSVLGPHAGKLRMLSESIASRLVRGDEDMKRINQDVQDAQRQDQQIVSNIAMLESSMQDIEARLSDSSAVYDGQADCQRSIESYQRQAQQHRAEAARLNAEIRSLISQNASLSSDSSRVGVGNIDYDEKETYGTVKQGVIKDKYETLEADAGYPITYVDERGGTQSVEEGSCGYFTDKSISGSEYSIRYVGPSHVYGWCKIKLFTEKRLTAENTSKVRSNESKISDYNTQIESCHERAKTADKEVALQEETIRKLFTQGRQNLEVLLRAKQGEKSRLQASQQSQMATVSKHQARIADIAKKISHDGGAFKMLHRLVTLIPQISHNVHLVRKMMTLLSYRWYQPLLQGRVVDVKHFGLDHPILSATEASTVDAVMAPQ